MMKESVLLANECWHGTIVALDRWAVPVILLAQNCSACDHPMIACLSGHERQGYLQTLDGFELERACVKCGDTVIFNEGSFVLYQR